jgi:hypothetical protein
MFDMRKTFVFCGCDELTIFYQTCCGVMKGRIDSKSVHIKSGFIFSDGCGWSLRGAMNGDVHSLPLYHAQLRYGLTISGGSH